MITHRSHSLTTAVVASPFSLPQLLRPHGYRTDAIRKIHVNPHETIVFDWRRGSDSMGVSSRSPQERKVVTQTGERITSHVGYSTNVEQVAGVTF